MSSGPSFKSILLITSTDVRLWTLERKVWTESKHKLSLNTAPSQEVIARTQGSNLLVLVSDAYTGHLQFVSDAKKESLTDEAIGQRLQDEFQIDVSAYEFATQRATLSRNQVQMSVSGIEAALYQQVTAWVPALLPRKIWVMPFGWFLVPLKSVEPVLLAVAGSKDSMFVSHHYLGVDDARELPLADLADYVLSRKEERKETHLLYVQAPAKVLKKLESALGDMVAVHPLLGESSEDPIREVITAVMAKGTDTLAELLHFEEDGAEGDESSVAASAPADAPPPAEAVPAVNIEDASTLPQPKPPKLSAPVAPAAVGAGMMVDDSLRARVTVEGEDDGDEADTDVEPETDDTAEVVESVSEAPVQAVEETEEETADANLADPEPVAVFAEEPEEETAVTLTEQSDAAAERMSALSRLAAEKSRQRQDAAQTVATVTPGQARYREVPPKRSWGVIALVFVGMVVLTILVGGAVFWSQQEQPQQQALIPAEASPTPTPAPTPTPTPTPAPTGLTLAQKKQLNTVVLNATSRAGLAGRYRTELNEAGWNVTSAGNATGEYAETGILIFTDDEAAFATLGQELGGVTVRRLSENEESVAATVDVVIILNQPVEPDVTPVDQAEDEEAAE